MRYLCVYCDAPFEAEGGDKPRCPKCMRVHGVRPAEAGAAADRPKRARAWLFALGGVLLLGALGWVAFDRWGRPAAVSAVGTVGGPGAAALAELRKAGDAGGARLASLLESNDAIEAFADRAAEGSGALDKARAVVKALRARASAEAFVRWPLVDPRRDSTLVASGVLDAVAKDNARHHLYPLEVAALAVSALRSVEVPAQLAEVFRFEGERSPPDPSARFGYFAVAVPGAAGQAPTLLDPYGGRAEVKPKADDYALLDDAEAVGGALGIEASSLVARNEDPASALALADQAVKLAPRSPSVRVARATVLLANAGLEEGTRELEAAAQLRGDGPRHHALAVLSLARGDRERALKEISLALEPYPDYAAAQITIALLHLSRMERDEAHAALEMAERLEPELTGVALAWAQFHASTGKVDEAVAQARRAVERDPAAIEAHLVLAGVYRQAARYDEMRAEAKQALSLVPAARRERTKMLIRSALGPTALEEDAAPAPAEPAAATLAPSGGAGASGSGKMRLLDHDLGAGPGTGGLKLGDDTQRLRLREPSQQLELDHR